MIPALYMYLSLPLSLSKWNKLLSLLQKPKTNKMKNWIDGLRMASKFYYKHGDCVIVLKLTIIHVVFVFDSYILKTLHV